MTTIECAHCRALANRGEIGSGDVREAVIEYAGAPLRPRLVCRPCFELLSNEDREEPCSA